MRKAHAKLEPAGSGSVCRVLTIDTGIGCSFGPNEGLIAAQTVAAYGHNGLLDQVVLPAFSQSVIMALETLVTGRPGYLICRALGDPCSLYAMLGDKGSALAG
jgi:hypothetical protein